MKKKILLFTEYFTPSVQSGEAESAKALVQNLKDEYDFDIICGCRDVTEDSLFLNLEKDKWIAHDGYNVQYLSSKFSNIWLLWKIFKSKTYDYYYISGIFSFYFSILPAIISKLNGKSKYTLIAPRGMLSDISLSTSFFKKKSYLMLTYVFRIYKDISWQATNETEKIYIEKYSKRHSKILVIPDCIIDYNVGIKEIIKNKRELKLVFVGQIVDKKNLLIVLNALSKIDCKVEFTIVGPIIDKKYWIKCERIIENFPHNFKVIYINSINKNDLFKLLQESYFLIFLSKYENFGHVVIESIQCGCPVITNFNTHWLDLDKFKIGWNIFDKSLDTYLNMISDMENAEYSLYRRNCHHFFKTYMLNQRSKQDVFWSMD